MPTAFVTGGAGYIGAHTCLRLAEAGFDVVVYDDLSSGHRDFVRWGPLIEGDVRDTDRLSRALAEHRPDVVLHFAALIEVSRSLQQPARFWDVNVGGTLSLLRALDADGPQRLVVSSTCSVYGQPQALPMTEQHPCQPLSPYAHTKLAVERALLDRAAAGAGFSAVVLRYFNAAGAAPEHGLGERHEPETHAIPLAIEAARGQRPFQLYGTDYPTRDGTCVRDYVHVLDLADAHVAAVRRLLDGGGTLVANLGTGRGTSVRQLVAAVGRVAQRELPVDERPRRAGDSPELVADAELARRELGWSPRHPDIESIVRSAWRWHAQPG